MPPRIKPSLQQRQRRQTRKRPSPDRTSPRVGGHGTDYAVNDDDDDDDHHHALRDEIDKLREERDFLRQTCASVVSQASGFQKALERIIAEQDRTVADLKAALEAEKTHRRALESQLQNHFNPRLHRWLNEDHASTPSAHASTPSAAHGEHPRVDGNDALTAFPFWQPVLTSADADLERTQSVIDSPPRM